jgi:hypothetical protein
MAPTITDWSSLCSYKQALHGAKAARALAAEHSLPFTRPDDFFAEMVKTDAHMERIRQRLLDESAGIAKSEARRREREGKKIGKQVQLEKLKERERSKKDMDERLKGLKRSASLSSFIAISSLITYYCEKNIKVLYITRKRMATRHLMLRWRMPSRTGGQRNAHAEARQVIVCRDMSVTRNLGLGAMGKGTSKIHVRRRTTLTRRRGEDRAGGCGVGVEVGEGKAIVGWGSRAA